MLCGDDGQSSCVFRGSTFAVAAIERSPCCTTVAVNLQDVELGWESRSYWVTLQKVVDGIQRSSRGGRKAALAAHPKRHFLGESGCFASRSLGNSFELFSFETSHARQWVRAVCV